ncbi:hypothetical protein BLNAU_15445 [Blattamonas nauphoetae]|uniref:PB1 domain-containing protein n=1 Tax=Blattamonas nauphoetae TaxID=2049346 RepID=A0ABQ9XHB4_9EUKA|nr:hypothetical protein BLNAU_15445 [Blattamonas nauphoetae]
MTFTFKIVCGQTLDIHRFLAPESITYEALSQKVCTLFALPDATKIIFKYVDDERDLVQLNSEDELAAAKEACKEKKSIKIFVLSREQQCCKDRRCAKDGCKEECKEECKENDCKDKECTQGKCDRNDKCCQKKCHNLRKQQKVLMMYNLLKYCDKHECRGRMPMHPPHHPPMHPFFHLNHPPYPHFRHGCRQGPPHCGRGCGGRGRDRRCRDYSTDRSCSEGRENRRECRRGRGSRSPPAFRGPPPPEFRAQYNPSSEPRDQQDPPREFRDRRQHQEYYGPSEYSEGREWRGHGGRHGGHRHGRHRGRHAQAWLYEAGQHDPVACDVILLQGDTAPSESYESQTESQ